MYDVIFDLVMAKVNKSYIELVVGDITDLEVDAIVNAANSRLKLGGGVAGAIRRKGGKIIQDECDKIGYCPVGEARITTGGDVKAKYVIHAVGPVYGEGEEDDKLRTATLNSLKLAEQYRITSLAFPAISAGIFGFPKNRCADIMLSATSSYLNGDTKLRQVIFCLHDSLTFDIFNKEYTFL
ncbi:[Protein ADP-ribosylglutamate] hydrolase [ANME-1 cluster archaeon GoMg2]|nr:[Protein ADP-ribosylglutamate] hydrolase [ANME-1 cluster archaeon GoMg2]